MARDMVAALQAFEERIRTRPGCNELGAWCRETIDLLARERCDTVDELAYKLRQHQKGTAVLRAKGVMTALFLDLEGEADLRPYRRAVRGMIDFEDLALPDSGQMNVPSRAFCITYNYDRCLEAAIFQEVVASGRGAQQGYSNSDLEVRVQRLVNSGLDTMRERIEAVDTTRFAVLKMHGIVGSVWDYDYPTGEPLCDFGRAAINDRILAAFRRDHSRESPTLIVFPWEVNDPPPFATTFVQETNRAATAFFSSVVELNFVGYSFHPLNAPRLDALLTNSPRLRVIQVHDPSPRTKRTLDALVARLNLDVQVIHHDEGWQP